MRTARMRCESKLRYADRGARRCHSDLVGHDLSGEVWTLALRCGSAILAVGEHHQELGLIEGAVSATPAHSVELRYRRATPTPRSPRLRRRHPPGSAWAGFPPRARSELAGGRHDDSWRGHRNTATGGLNASAPMYIVPGSKERSGGCRSASGIPEAAATAQESIILLHGACCRPMGAQ